MRAAVIAGSLFTLVFMSAPVHAGRSCDEKPADPNRLMQGFELAQKVKITSINLAPSSQSSRVSVKICRSIASSTLI